jgi:hypothetical protein
MEISQASKRGAILAVAIGCLIALNLVTFAEAYPQTTVIDSGCCGNRPLQKDFSAFYTAAWRLFNDPSHVYTPGNVNDGGAQTTPPPEAYKYLPSFLLMVAPFLALGYQQALTAFDVFQLLLLPLMAVLICALVQKRGTAVALVVVAVVLVLPLPWPHWGLSVPYYWQWVEGQSKVLETFLLLLSFYLGQKKRPKLSGLAFALTAFDPRFTLLSIPLFVFYNRRDLREASLVAIAAFAASNAALVYPGVGSGFLSMLLSSGLSTPLYWYALIPLSAIVALTVLNAREIGRTFRGLVRAQG